MIRAVPLTPQTDRLLRAVVGGHVPEQLAVLVRCRDCRCLWPCPTQVAAARALVTPEAV